MAAGTLFTYPENFRAYKALVAAQYSGFQLNVDKSFTFGQTNKSPEFRKKFACGKVPAFESADGLCLNESNAIAAYVANEALLGTNKADSARIIQWINFADNDILPAACTWVFPCMGVMQYNKPNTERSKEEIKAALGLLNEALASRTFLVGERVTLADISVACNLLLLYQWVLEPAFRQPYVHTNRWFLTVVNQPQFKAVIPEVKLCEKMAQFDAKKFAEMSGSSDKKKEKKDVKKEQKKEQKPKTETTQKPKESEPPAPAEEPKKPKDPFLKFPAGSFVMDEWKKVYSNEDTDTVALPYFFEKFDPEHYSIWYCEYDYNKDLTIMFMNLNLIGGMLQRLDGMRKHGFGSMLLFGENNNAFISGLWAWRGHELAFSLSDDLNVDAGSYTWRKLEWGSEECKKKVTEYWNWTVMYNGFEVYDGKIFK